MPNHLIRETSPYLLQHAYNPVDWYPWGEEAFSRAKAEDKPVFLSIGYSTCHWCHVMARESFEDEEIAAVLNRSFISVKVDREERPDLDNVYMEACRAMSASAGWPMTLFLTPEKEPFFAGTYFPRHSRRGTLGLLELLGLVEEKWASERESLVQSAGELASALRERAAETPVTAEADGKLIEGALWLFLRSYDEHYGGFGDAPKFPMPHNLMFLLREWPKRGDERLLHMAERTLERMLSGGLFDQLGGGFCRYSTDRAFLIPHFEKMLYDNALLTETCALAFGLTRRPDFLRGAKRTADYVLRELTGPEGGFFSAQDADSDGEEGKHYLFAPAELTELLGKEDGEDFCAHYGITQRGNFEGKSHPNRLHAGPDDGRFDALLPRVLEYRRSRCPLRTDDKVLSAWNGLMISGLCALWRVSGEVKYLDAARRAWDFLEANLREGETLFVSFREGRRSGRGTLGEYAAVIRAGLSLYGATLEDGYLAASEALCRRAAADFFDRENGGFYLTPGDGEELLLRPKESYDGAQPSGNSLMAENLLRLSILCPAGQWEEMLEKQLDWQGAQAALDPSGHAMYLLVLSDRLAPPPQVTVSLRDRAEVRDLPLRVPLEVPVRVAEAGSEEYPLLNGKTTFYVCRENVCLPGTNALEL